MHPDQWVLLQFRIHRLPVRNAFLKSQFSIRCLFQIKFLCFTGLTNKCKKLNGGCEDVCQLDAVGSVLCSCHEGRHLLKDGYRCVTRDETRNCSDTEFQCSNGDCIPYDWTCDLQPQCTDGSDEDPRFCGQ